MKKILLASTALFATAGVASADVTLNGDGYFGVGYSDVDSQYVNSRTGDSSDYAFVYDLDFQFVGTAETDSGLVVGASIDADDATKSQGPLGWDGSAFVSGSFGTLSMGDTDGGAEAVIGDLAGVGLTGLGDLNETTFLLGASSPVCTYNNRGTITTVDDNGDPIEVTGQLIDSNGNPIQGTFGGCGSGALALYEYSFSGLSLALGLNDDEGYSVGAGYDGGIWSVGLAYESIQGGTPVVIYNNNGRVITLPANQDTEQLIGQGSVTFSNVTLKAIWGQVDAGETIDQYGVSASGTWGATTVTAYYRGIDGDDLAQIYGIGAAYDLGGGAALEAGVVAIDTEDFVDGDYNTIADFGLSFKF